MKRKIFTLILCLAMVGVVSAQRKTMTIQVASKPATTDGIIDANDPWISANWVDVAVGKETNVGDMSAKFQLMYDETNLYFGAQIIDGDRFTGNGTTYTNDCIEFFIAMDTTSGEAGTYKTGDKQLRLQAVEDPSATGGAIECGQGAPESGAYVCKDNGDNYVQEWSMPWAELTADMDPEWDQKQFKFDIQVANCTADGQRTQQMFWENSSDEQWRNTTYFGVVTLATPIYELGAPVEGDLVIEVASKPVVADGIIDASDPWVSANWVDVTVGKETNVGDMSAKFQLMYDKTNLYFGAQVIDGDRFTGNGTTYTNDCIEFFIAMDTTSGEAGTYKQGDKQLRLQAVEDPSATGGAIESGQGAPESGQYVCKDNGDNYVQEWIMPWAELSADMDPEWDQKQFKFDIQVANCTADGQRTQQMFWNNSSDEQWRNTNYFGLVALKTPVNLLPSGIKNVTKASFTYNRGLEQLEGVKGMVSVYDVTGKLVMKSIAKNNTVNVAALKQGIYIVSANNSSLKIVK